MKNNDLMPLLEGLLRILKNPVVQIAGVATRVSPYTHASFEGCPADPETVRPGRQPLAMYALPRQVPLPA
jgi:hypothetical protein